MLIADSAEQDYDVHINAIFQKYSAFNLSIKPVPHPHPHPFSIFFDLPCCVGGFFAMQ